MTRTYRRILAEADEHFNRVAAEQPEQISCRRGCSLCCYGLFEISAADVALLVDAFGSLSRLDQDRLVRSAQRLIDESDHPDLREAAPAEKEAFFARTDALACPALHADGACSIYASRPLVCRTFGLPLREGDRLIGEVCELNFNTASTDAIERAAWDLLGEDVLGPEDEFTVPEAILIAARVHRTVPADDSIG